MFVEPTIDLQDAAIRHVVPEGVTVEQVATGFAFTEGPVWYFDSLLFVDIPRRRTVRLRTQAEGPEVSSFRFPNGKANGQTLDRIGRLIVCESGARRVTRTELDGSVEVLAERYEGHRLNAPNDVVVRSDGSVYFTDPAYTSPLESWKEMPFNGVFRVGPDGELAAVAEDFRTPNGLAFTPDEHVLYICDTARRHLRAFDVNRDGSLSNSRVFFDFSSSSDPGPVDGMKVDQEGNVYCTGPGGVWLITPNGKFLGRIRLPEIACNLAWGAEDSRTLYITATTSVYRVSLSIPGIVPMPKHIARARDTGAHRQP